MRLSIDPTKPEDRWAYQKVTGRTLRKPRTSEPVKRRSFVGIDGEGGNIPVTEVGTMFDVIRHRYLLLRAGEHVIENSEGLTFYEIAEFLVNLPRTGVYVGYFFDYDVTMIIRDLPEERARKLLNYADRAARGRNGPLPVDVGPYQIDYLPHKYFKIRKKMEDGYYDNWLLIHDVGTFFQSAFVKTLKKWNVTDQNTLDLIQAGKDQRSEFADMTDETREYNKMEIVLLEKLMAMFRDVCYEIGYVPREWQGPGRLAVAGLKKHKIPKHDELESFNNRIFRQIANSAYYGGRFEITAHGPIKTKVWQYDINSAYPHMLRNLPCLQHGTWKQTQDPKELDWTGKLPFLAEVEFEHEDNINLGWFPTRNDKGNIQYPLKGKGTYWSNDIVPAVNTGQIKGMNFYRAWQYEKRCDCRPFAFLEDLYAMRKKLGKSNKGHALKLFMNSIYGKLAQSIGMAPYANPVWAGLITSGCRGMITDACAKHSDKVYMIATDGIFVGEEVEEVTTGDKLGEWELTEHDEGMFIVQPGIYFLPDGDAKTRGIPFSKVHQKRDVFEEVWQTEIVEKHHYHTAYVSVEVDNFISAKQALARNKWSSAGQWITDDRKVGFSWITKRHFIPFVDEHGILRTKPYGGIQGMESTAYKRAIGGNIHTDEKYTSAALMEEERMMEQPDWVTPFVGDPENFSSIKLDGYGEG